MRTATIGQLMIDEALPAEMKGRQWTLDKKGLSALMTELAKEHPEAYREVAHKLSKIGLRVAYTTGGNSFGLRHLQRPTISRQHKKRLLNRVNRILDNDDLDDDKRDQLILRTLGDFAPKQQQLIFEAAKTAGNPLAAQVTSGSRGNPMNLASLLGGDLLYADHRGRPIPVPVLNNYSEGLTPVEYWAGAYGARKGTIDVKFATQDAGFLSKQFNQLAHRLVVTALDAEKDSDAVRGLPVDVDDDENEGALLAAPVGGYKRNTILTPKILESLRRRKIKRLLVRSPTVGGPSDGGIYARDVGVREYGRLPWRGENPGMTAAQAMSEPLSQAQLSSKHGGGVVGSSAESAVGGFDWINQLVQTPKHFKGGAAHAGIDGLVQRIEDAPAGGKYVWIENQRHYVGKGFDPKVEKGQHVEAGDVISDGSPNPAAVVKYKGIGEGRRYFIKAFRQAYRDAGIKGHRRNIELLARGLINHVRLTQEMGDYVPDDVVPYQALESVYKPRAGYVTASPKAAVGKYLERPYLHYSVGTKVRPSMMQDFTDFGVTSLDVHDDEPPFEPEMIRGMANLQHDPDWLSRMFGTGQKKSLLTAVHRGGTSDTQGTSFVPGLAQGVGFGRTGKITSPKPHPGLAPQQEKRSWPWSAEPAPPPVSNLSPEAARQLLLANYQAERRARALQGFEKGRERVFGRDTVLGNLISTASGLAETGAVFSKTPLWLLSLAKRKDPYENLAPGEVGPLDYYVPQGTLLDSEMLGHMAVEGKANEVIDQLTTRNPDYAYEAVQGDQYLLPGQGKWIDQYNAAIRAGQQPPAHVAMNAANELSTAPQYADSGAHWLDQVRSPEMAKMMRDQQVFDAHTEHRSRQARVTANHIHAALEKQYPGYTMVQHGQLPPAGYKGPGMQVALAIDSAGQVFASKPDKSLGEYQTYVNKILTDNGINPATLQVNQESFQNSLAAEDRALSGNLQEFERDYQYEIASPQEREALLKTWEQQEQAANPTAPATEQTAQAPVTPEQPPQPPQPTQPPPQPAVPQSPQGQQPANPSAGMQTPWGLQAAGMFPEQTRQMLQMMGPAAIGGYGLLFNPQAALSLVRGPDNGKVQRPQPPQPAIPRRPVPQAAPQQPRPVPQPAPVNTPQKPVNLSPGRSGIMPQPPMKVPKPKPVKPAMKPPISAVPG